MRVFIESHGCRLNQAEGDAMGALLAGAGHVRVDEVEGAELIVVNGCTVTHGADADARKRIRALHKLRPDARVVVTGCFANMHADLAAELPGVAAVLGNAEKDDIVRIASTLEARPRTRLPVIQALTPLSRAREGRRPHIQRPPLTHLPAAPSSRRTRAYLRVQDGCNYQCSFCIVPQVRGRSRSLPSGEAAAQLQRLLAAGIPEVALTGVHLGTWGWEMGERRPGLARLLRELDTVLRGSLDTPGRVRLGSLDPHELSSDIIDVVANGAPRLARHVHLPVQSGDDGVLARMRRSHRRADLGRAVQELARRVSGVAIGTDMIVGFPGEDDAAFEASVGLFDELPLHYAHVFRYSPREGTEAAGWTDRADPDQSSRRNAVLRQRVARNWLRFRESQLGETLEVIVWRRRARTSGRLVGLTDNYIKVEFDGPDALMGGRARVRLEAVRGERSSGVLVAPGWDAPDMPDMPDMPTG